jgi:mono/diheme cytochrome c family protein
MLSVQGSVRLALVGVLIAGACAVIACAGSQRAASASATSATSSTSQADGAAIYASNCASCHKADGKGGGPFPALAGSSQVTAKDPTAIIVVTEHGKALMPAFKPRLSNAEIAAVITYIRTTWGNKATPVTEAEVAAVH